MLTEHTLGVWAWVITPTTGAGPQESHDGSDELFGI